ncbi:MAG: hypothetical protein QXV32_02335 [Conexivisphaerales archaeon]
MAERSADITNSYLRSSRLRLVSSLGFMLLGLLVGIFRLMNLHGIQVYPSFLIPLYEAHPNIMVFGFLAPIIMSERYAGISILNLQKSSILASRLMVPLTQAGLLLQIAGDFAGIFYFALIGSFLIFAGLLCFIFLMFSLSKKTGIRLPFYFMILSIFPLEAYAILTYRSGFISNAPEAVMLLLFPAIFIFGERIELTRYSTTSYSESKFRLGFYGCILLFILTLAATVSSSDSSWLMASAFTIMIIVAALILTDESSNFKRIIKSKFPLQRYVMANVAVAYFWLIAASVFGIYFFAFSAGNAYDAMIHAMAVGFIGTMLLAHGPVILPSLLKRRSPLNPSTMPLVILTLSNSLRISGDFFYNGYFAIVSGISGWLILIAVLLFVRTIFFS